VRVEGFIGILLRGQQQADAVCDAGTVWSVALAQHVEASGVSAKNVGLSASTV
jgi:hypothetical protein